MSLQDTIEYLDKYMKEFEDKSELFTGDHKAILLSDATVLKTVANALRRLEK